MAETKPKNIWDELRKPFPKGTVGLLPKPYKRDSPKGNCNVCGGYHGLPAVHLDYVGHAAVTDRLNNVEPTWTWEPMAFDQYGSPALDKDGNLWIKLTIDGVTRIGVGDGNNMKERIGDAIRNAAMRFGVALDLWTKDELESTLDQPEAKNDKASENLSPHPEEPSRDIKEEEPISNAQFQKIQNLIHGRGITDDKQTLSIIQRFAQSNYKLDSAKKLTQSQAEEIIATIGMMDGDALKNLVAE